MREENSNNTHKQNLNFLRLHFMKNGKLNEMNANDYCQQQQCSSSSLAVTPGPGNKRVIHELSDVVSRKICTGQVIVSLAGACRELIDNSLDAGATNIEIRATENGTELLEVIDNGSGIALTDFDKLCKPHCTSKLTEFQDFKSLNSYGFRGEALNALAALSDVHIVTRDTESKSGWRLSFGRNGDILKREQCSRLQGTTVSVCHLFKLLPVRRKEFIKNSRREFLKLVECIQAFALSRPDCRFNCSNIVNGKRSQMISSPGGTASLPEVVSSLFGVGIGRQGLLELEQAVPSEEMEQIYGLSTQRDRESVEKVYGEINLYGYVSSCESGQGRSNCDRQFVFVNRRHVDYPKLCRIANEVYSLYNRTQHCTLVLFVDLPSASLDVNVSPDKRIVFLQHEKQLFAKLRASLLATFVKVQGNCPIAAGTTPGKQSKKRPISSLLRWRDSQIKNEPEEQDQQQGVNEKIFEQNDAFNSAFFGNESSSIIQPETPKRQRRSLLNYSTFVHGANESALNSTRLPVHLSAELNDAMMEEASTEEVCFDNSDERAADDLQQNREEEGGDEADESSFLFEQEQSFNADDSQNLRDTFVLDTPRLSFHNNSSASNSGQRRKQPAEHADSSNIERTLPVRSFQGFKSAATLLPQQHSQQEPIMKTPKRVGGGQVIREGGFSSGKNKHSSALRTLEHFNFRSFRRTELATILPVKEENILMENIAADMADEQEEEKRAEELDDVIAEQAEEDVDDHLPDERASICSPPPADASSSLPSSPASCSISSSSVFEDATPPNSPSSSANFNSRPHQPVHVSMDMLKRRFLLQGRRKRIDSSSSQTTMEDEVVEDGKENEAAEKKKKATNEGNMPMMIEEVDLDFDEHNAELVKHEIERKLSLMLSKSDFARMQLIGQFNNAFLLARLGPQLFMIDQHAADEKFNFEMLQARSTVKSQKLIDAQPLQLGSVNAALLKDNLELFQKNGFEFQFNGEEEENVDKEVHQQDGREDCDDDMGQEQPACSSVSGNCSVLLTSSPQISGYNFDRHDIDQLLSLMAEMPGQMHRPNKIRAIFASKACRKSVMFGEALPEPKMQEIITNMGQLEQPWNCPHGRPTIRHLGTVHIPRP